MTYPATSSYGIPQGDVILRSALVYGLQELRVYPNLVDDALCWLVKDDLTAEAYGQSEVGVHQHVGRAVEDVTEREEGRHAVG